MEFEGRVRGKPVNESLKAQIDVEKKKVKQLEDAIELITHNIERDTARYSLVNRDLKMLSAHTDEKINDVEMQIR